MKKSTVVILSIIGLTILNGVAFVLLLHGKQESVVPDSITTDVSHEEETKRGDAVPEKSVANSLREQLEKSLVAEHVIAHRGIAGESKEHSFDAYDSVISEGVRLIEQDIVISEDGTLYVSHDKNAWRMTGSNREYSSMKDEEIDQLRTHEGDKILRLSEVFDRYGTTVNYVIELKSKDQNTENAFVDLVNQYEFAERIIVECFSLETLKYLEEVFPNMPKLYLCEYPQYLEQGYEAEYIDIISVETSMMTEENVKRAHDMGKLFSVWVINSEDNIRKAIDLGVDYYFTDDVSTAISIEKDYGYETRMKK